MFRAKDTIKRRPGIGHGLRECQGYPNGSKLVNYAQYYGRLNKAGDIGSLKTIVLSTAGKVYQLNDNGKHVELKWQNDKTNKNVAFGTINLIGEGKNYQCSILEAFKTELSLYL